MFTSVSRPENDDASLENYALELPSVELLRSIFDYNSDTGTLIWRARNDVPKEWNTRHAGKTAYSKSINGYIRVAINGTRYQAHRIVWKLYYGVEPPSFIDHKDRDKTNNRISNLREVTRSQNNVNRSVAKRDLPRGVCFHKPTEKYKARTKKNGREVYLGLHDTVEAAEQAVIQGMKQVHGGFSPC